MHNHLQKKTMWRKRVSLKLILSVGILAYILFNVATLHQLSNCKVFNATYVFKDQRGQFEAVIEVDSDLIEEEVAETADGDADEIAGKSTGTKPACDCVNLGLPAEISSISPTVLCAMWPPYLVGRLGITINTTSEDLLNKTAISLLAHGGFYKPRDCVARERVAIIVPYRDRPRHLKLLLLHLHSVLQRQQLHYGIFVVEMAYPTQFNRGLLGNVGFLSAREMQNFTCYVIHDVDQLPADDRNLYRCSSNPRHLSVSSMYGFKLPYSRFIGGVFAFTPDQFVRINGFSNSYFGFGKEDADLYKRILYAKYKVDRPAPEIGVYVEFSRTRVIRNPDNPMKDDIYVTTPGRFKVDGVNSVLYTRLALEYRPLYTWIYVNSSKELIMARLKGF